MTSYTYQTAASAARRPRTYRGPAGTQNVPRGLLTTFDTTERMLFNADYTHTLEGAGRHLVKGGIGYQYALNDIDSRYPGGYVDIFWGIPAVFPGQRRRSRRVWLLRRYQSRTIRQSRCEHRLPLCAGPVADRAPPDLEHRRPYGKREGSCVQNRTAGSTCSISVLARRSLRAWDSATTSLGTGRAKLYASWGRYFDWTKYEMAAQPCSAVRSGASTTERSMTRTHPITANADEHAGPGSVDRVPAPVAIAAYPASKRSTTMRSRCRRTASARASTSKSTRARWRPSTSCTTT